MIVALLTRLGVTAFLACLIKVGVAFGGHSIAWVWAVLIAAVLTFGGVLILDGDWLD